MRLKIAGLNRESLLDGPGIRYVIFTQGCDRHCPGCHNPVAHDPAGGEWIECADLVADIRAARHLDGVTFSGGEPFLQAAAGADIAEQARSFGLHILSYTGFTLEELIVVRDPAQQRFLGLIDTLVDGPYIEAERDLRLPFRGSRNQRILDVVASLKAGIPVPDDPEARHLMKSDRADGGRRSVGADNGQSFCNSL